MRLVAAATWRDHHLGRRAGHARGVVVLGQPVAPVAPRLGRARQVDRVGDRLPGGHAGRDRRQVEDGERDGHPPESSARTPRLPPGDGSRLGCANDLGADWGFARAGRTHDDAVSPREPGRRRSRGVGVHGPVAAVGRRTSGPAAGHLAGLRGRGERGRPLPERLHRGVRPLRLGRRPHRLLGAVRDGGGGGVVGHPAERQPGDRAAPPRGRGRSRAAGAALPTPDAIGTTDLSATAGKVALVSSFVPLTGACPTGPKVVDLVGYGAAANCFEGAGPTPSPSNTLSATRKLAGCTDTGEQRRGLPGARSQPPHHAVGRDPLRADSRGPGAERDRPGLAGGQHLAEGHRQRRGRHHGRDLHERDVHGDPGRQRHRGPVRLARDHGVGARRLDDELPRPGLRLPQHLGVLEQLAHLRRGRGDAHPAAPPTPASPGRGGGAHGGGVASIAGPSASVAQTSGQTATGTGRVVWRGSNYPNLKTVAKRTGVPIRNLAPYRTSRRHWIARVV